MRYIYTDIVLYFLQNSRRVLIIYFSFQCRTFSIAFLMSENLSLRLDSGIVVIEITRLFTDRQLNNTQTSFYNHEWTSNQGKSFPLWCFLYIIASIVIIRCFHSTIKSFYVSVWLIVSKYWLEVLLYKPTQNHNWYQN